MQLSYVDQSRDDLTADNTVYEEITGGVDHLKVGNREIHGRAYVASFNFKGTDQQKRVGDLSGGERNRVHLAKLLKDGGNVLLLDEPTNDLDVDTLRALEAGLESFPGCAVVISHDRWFLDRIATHVLAFEGESQVRWFEGNFTEYEEWRHKELGAAADQPHRIHYKNASAGLTPRRTPVTPGSVAGMCLNCVSTAEAIASRGRSSATWSRAGPPDARPRRASRRSRTRWPTTCARWRSCAASTSTRSRSSAPTRSPRPRRGCRARPAAAGASAQPPPRGRRRTLALLGPAHRLPQPAHHPVDQRRAAPASPARRSTG